MPSSFEYTSTLHDLYLHISPYLWPDANAANRPTNTLAPGCFCVEHRLCERGCLPSVGGLAIERWNSVYVCMQRYRPAPPAAIGASQPSQPYLSVVHHPLSHVHSLWCIQSRNTFRSLSPSCRPPHRQHRSTSGGEASVKAPLRGRSHCCRATPSKALGKQQPHDRSQIPRWQVCRWARGCWHATVAFVWCGKLDSSQITKLRLRRCLLCPTYTTHTVSCAAMST